jgi:hypothetical protein
MHIHLWPYKAIYIGISPDNDVHAHHAVQICIGLDKDISVQDYKAQSIHTGQCIVIFEDVPHKVLAQDNQIVVIYLEPEDRQNQQFLKALRQARSDGINTLPLTSKELGSISQHLFTDVDIDKRSVIRNPSTISGSWGLNVVLQARQVYRRRTTQRVTRLPWMGRSR